VDAPARMYGVVDVSPDGRRLADVLRRRQRAAVSYNRDVRGSTFDEVAFFRSIAGSGARALLIGRRALVLLGLPVLTADYDFWIHIDDIERFNATAAAFELHPTHAPEDARRRGRYVLENDEHVDVLVARSVPTLEGRAVTFEQLWRDRRSIQLPGAPVAVPSIAGLILTKQIKSRPKDLEDIRLLRAISEGEE
jgi:hypothetical protein